MTLDQIGVGLSAIVINLHSVDAERRRMLDLGIVPGTRIETVMRSPLGDPIAYRIRGSVVALRHEQARMIEVQTPTEQTLQETRR